MRTLYHYTSIERWDTIRDSGYLKLVESNISFTREHVGPDVVWLTTDPNFEYQHGLGLGHSLDGTDKSRIRITVELPNNLVFKWRDWAARRGSADETMGGLIESSGGGAGTWRVTERRIGLPRWRQVLDRRSGEILFAA